MSAILPHHFNDAINAFFEGYGWGLAALSAEKRKSIVHLIPEGKVAGLSQTDFSQIRQFFVKPGAGKEALLAWDKLVDENSLLEDAREYGVDMLALSLIINGSYTHGDEFLDGSDWLEFEEEMGDRGTELMSLMTYLADCKENNVFPAFEDYIHSFLLDSDDQNQDEFFIYEELLSRQEMLQESPEEIVREGNLIKGDMEDIFTPLLLFFKGISVKDAPGLPMILKKSDLAQVHAAILLFLHKLERSGSIQIF